MQKKLWMVPLFLFVSLITHAQPGADWQNPAVFDRNQVIPHAELVPFDPIQDGIGNQREKSDARTIAILQESNQPQRSG